MEKINKVFKNGEPLSAEELNGIVRYINELGETIEENLDNWSSLNAVEEMWNSLKEDDDSNRIHNSHSPLSYPLSSINGANLGLPPYSDMTIASDGNGGWLWKKVNQGGGGGSGSSSLQGINKLRTYFLNVTHGIVPSAPSVNNYNSSPQDNFINGQDVWTFTNINPTNDQDTYAIWVWFLSNIPVNIDGPIKIFDGVINSSNGEDGEEIEWIYRRVSVLPSETTLNSWENTLANCIGSASAQNEKTFENADAVPFDWYDNPQGVTYTEKYEYASFRRSVNGSDGKRVWGTTGFCRPFIWSTYGEKGMDGDGIEYIFWGKAEEVTNWGTFSQNQENAPNYPPGWTNNEGFQDNEYFGPNGSLWTDDPLGINDTTRRYIYMSKRKKVQDPLTGISSWESFSIPVLWNLYTGTSFMSNIFKRSPTKPNKPGANEGSFLNPVPTGWSDGIPAGTDSIWITSRIFSSNGQYPQQEGWSDVQLMSDTESFDVEFSPIESNPGTPTTNPNNWYDPTTDTNANWTNMIWMATRTKSNGVWGNWNITKIKGEKGDPGSSSTFDDTELRNAITTLNNTIAGEKSRLDGVINNLNNSIQTEVESLLDDATWVQNNFPEGSGSSSNFGQQDVENYLQTIGVWSNDEVHNKTNAAWSKISQSVSEITSRVATLETNGIDTQSLSSTINQKIANGEIQLNLDNTYAKKSDVDDVEQIIEWMYSGLRTSTGQDKTIAQLTAAGKSGLTSAIADIRTQVNKLENGDYLATASVDAKVKDSISGMLATADSTTAAGLFFSNVGTALTAGLITEANLSTKAASAGLLAENLLTGKVAAILATVGRNGSNITLDADQLNITSDFINAMNASLSVASVTTELILAAIADGLIIKAGKVNFQKADGTAAPISINVNDGTLLAENASLSGTFTSSSDLAKIIINTQTRTEQYNPNYILNTVSSSILMQAYNNMEYDEVIYNEGEENEYYDYKFKKTEESLLVDVLTIGVNEVLLSDDSGNILNVGYDGMIRIRSTASSGRVATFSPENISCSDGYGAGASLAYGTIRASGFSRKLSALEKISYALDSTFIPSGASKYTLSMGFGSTGGSGLLAIRTESAPYANTSTTSNGSYSSSALVLNEDIYNAINNEKTSSVYTILVADEKDSRLEFNNGTPDEKIVIGIDGIHIGTDWSIKWDQFKTKLNQI